MIRGFPVLAAAVLALSFAGTTAAQAPAWPVKPVRLIVAYPPGGSTDVAARLVAEPLSKALGVPVFVENKPGAGGTIGALFSAKSDPDGYTLHFGSAAETSIARVTMKAVPFETLRDFQPVSLVGRVPFLLVTHAALPPNNLRELIDWIRANPGKVNYSSFGNNTTNHLVGEAFKVAAGVEAAHIPYKGSAPSVADLIGGQVQYTFDTITAVLPQVKGGRLKAIAVATAQRSALVPDSVLQQVLSPLVVGVPANAVETKNGVAQTRCTGDQRSVRFVVNDLTNSREVEIACLPPNELGPGKTVILENLRNGERKCARTGTDGRFRIPIPADVLDRLDLQIYDAPDAVVSYKGCEVLPGAPVGRRVRTFEQAAVSFTPVANTAKTCEAAIAASAVDAPSGCAQFRDFFFPVGSPLVSPQEGLGLTRQSPEARRLFALVQAALDSGDPINFAPYYGLRDAPGLDGAPMPPRAIIEWNTTGDPLVPAGTGWAFGRAAGAVPFLPPTFATSHPAWADYATPQALFDALGGKTPNEVLIATSSLESLARFERSRSGPACKANYVSSPTCTAPPSTADCARALWDVDWLAEGANQFDAPHPPVPLRLARAADVRAADPAAVARAWAPRIVGSPFTPDPPNAPAPPLVGVLGAYIQMGGQHVFVNGDPCKAFDDTRYNVNLLARFLATRGTDLYALSHPSTHRCLEKETCGFFAP